MPITRTFEVKKEREPHVSLSIEFKNRDIQRTALRDSLVEAMESIEKQSIVISTGDEVRLVEEIKTGLVHDEDPKVLMQVYEELISSIRKTKVTV